MATITFDQMCDIEFLKYIMQLDTILRTTGWSGRKYMRARVLRIVETLEDNGFDTVVGAMLRGYGVDRQELNPYFIA